MCRPLVPGTYIKGDKYMISIEDIEKIMCMIEKHDFSRFEFEQDNSRIVIERGTGEKMAPKEQKITEASSSVKETISKENMEEDYIKSSLAGTFYLRREENAEPLAKLHDMVKEDTVVGLVEVMKLFNELEAGISGEIVDILVKDGEFVEYGQPLFKVKGN